MNVLITQRHSKNQYGDDIESLESNYYKYFQFYGGQLVIFYTFTVSLKFASEQELPALRIKA